MTYYRPDYTLQKARKLIEEIKKGEVFNTNDTFDNIEVKELLLYLVKHQDDKLEEKNKRLNEYSDFFKTMGKFLPNKNILR